MTLCRSVVHSLCLKRLLQLTSYTSWSSAVRRLQKSIRSEWCSTIWTWHRRSTKWRGQNLYSKMKQHRRGTMCSSLSTHCRSCPDWVRERLRRPIRPCLEVALTRWAGSIFQSQTNLRSLSPSPLHHSFSKGSKTSSLRKKWQSWWLKTQTWSLLTPQLWKHRSSWWKSKSNPSILSQSTISQVKKLKWLLTKPSSSSNRTRWVCQRRLVASLKTMRAVQACLRDCSPCKSISLRTSGRLRLHQTHRLTCSPVLCLSVMRHSIWRG